MSEYPITLQTDELKVECTQSCDKIERFMAKNGEHLTIEELKAFLDGMKYSSKEVERATLQEVYKELARVGMCLDINLEGSAKYEITMEMAKSMWIIAHVKYFTEYIRSKGETELLDYVASWLKIICEQEAMNYGDVEKYI